MTYVFVLFIIYKQEKLVGVIIFLIVQIISKYLIINKIIVVTLCNKMLHEIISYSLNYILYCLQ